jgi:hypothetical protein
LSLFFSYLVFAALLIPVSAAIVEAEKILGKPLLKEKQERVQRIGSWDRANG